MGRVDGKVAIISGGARGQGAAEGRLLASEGAKVVLGDIRDEEGRQTAAQIRGEGGEAIYIHLDVTVEEDWRRAVETTVSTYGKLDVLVNNAGGGSSTHRIDEMPVEVWDSMIALNVKGAFLGTKHAIPAMRRAGGGSIINISSPSGLVASQRASSAYAAAKGAVRIFSKATAIQHAKDNIRCNSVHAGPIDTPLIQANLANPDTQGDFMRITPLGRIGTTDDSAYGVLFLASDESSFMTGSELVIDGGRTAQ